jgi:hypothetical protein
MAMVAEGESVRRTLLPIMATKALTIRSQQPSRPRFSGLLELNYSPGGKSSVALQSVRDATRGVQLTFSALRLLATVTGRCEPVRALNGSLQAVVCGERASRPLPLGGGSAFADGGIERDPMIAWLAKSLEQTEVEVRRKIAAKEYEFVYSEFDLPYFCDTETLKQTYVQTEQIDYYTYFGHSPVRVWRPKR